MTTYSDTIKGTGKKGLLPVTVAASHKRASDALGDKFKVKRISRTGQEYTILYHTARGRGITAAELVTKLGYY